MRNYRTAFFVTSVSTLLLAGSLVFLWLDPGNALRPTNQTESQPDGRPAAALQSAAVAPVQLSPQRMQSIGVKTGLVKWKSVHDQIRTTGNVEVDETRLSYVQVRFPGWIQKVFADSTYQFVQKGQPLFTIYSPDLVTTEQEYLLARENHALLAQSSVPGVASGAASLLNSTEERLRQWEIPEREILQLEKTGTARRELEIDSPASGYITERNALPNMYAQPGVKLYTLTDLSQVWVYAEVFQNDIGRVKVGDSARVTVDAYPGRIFTGRVSFIWPQVDPATRTVRVRLEFPNRTLALSLGMFVNVSLDIPLGRQLVIPASGVFHSGTRQIAFIDHGNGYIEPRDITTGATTDDEAIVLSGLKAGEHIVTSANFLIDSESQLQAALGSFAPPPPGAGAAASMNAPSSATIDYSSVPNPPHKGPNTFRVKLTSSSGAPIGGAQVTITFFMPAMPAMGMAAMRMASTLSDKGGGVYEGSGELQSGGAWQVTVLATRNGQAIAQKQFSVQAEGGM
ncbi:MAG TPA: efflux RND transporter periplasmic adaptor subunit [Bryobacteraceae bacterium]|nr:efflux RND transporter periplasmic adaptor subunit [Bryobacteraceae bacterium]